MGLLHILALVVRNVLAGSLDGLVFGPELLDTDILVDGVALLLVLGMAFLSRGGLAQSLDSLGAFLLVLGHTDLLLLLLVLSVPQGDILGPALDARRAGNLFGRTDDGCSTIVTGSWGSKGHGCKEHG